MRRIALWLYSAAWWLLLPMVLVRLLWRSRYEPGYRRYLPERFGWYRPSAPSPSEAPLIWVHAVSVGETRAAEPLIDALLNEHPAHRLLLTHMTPTGRATGAALYGKQVCRHGARVIQCYLPYDTGWMTARFLRHFQPRLCVLMETEVWPNLVAQCARHQVPVALVNARLSARSLRRGKHFAALLQPAAQRVSCVAAQTESDAQRLRQMGAPNVSVTGSIKFDVAPPISLLSTGAALRAQLNMSIGHRPVLLCASTRDGEEALILDALLAARHAAVVQPLLVIVPRHPQRFDEVAAIIKSRGLLLQRRSSLRLPDEAAASAPENGDVWDVLLGDSMGELFAYYAACDIAFIGGSLLQLGGQNLIEACAVGKPVLIGPHTFNFQTISDDAIAEGAALRVNDADGMLAAANALLAAPAQLTHMSVCASAFAQRHRGATERTMVLLNALII